MIARFPPRANRRLLPQPLLLLLALVPCDDNRGPHLCGVPPNLDTLVGRSATDAVCFEDPDGDRLSYSIEVRNPDIISATIAGVTDDRVSGVIDGVDAAVSGLVSGAGEAAEYLKRLEEIRAAIEGRMTSGTGGRP